MFLFLHSDGYHKLIRWGLVIHGAIDGFSRLIIYLHFADNNRSSTVRDCCGQGTRRFGIPSRVRCDKGGENYGVAELMLNYWGHDRNSVLVGPSVHNQRIERLWRDLFDTIIQLYYRLFYYMEKCEILDPLNQLHLFSLHYCFIPKINEALVKFQEGWNMHPMSGCHGKSPTQMYITGLNTLKLKNIIADDFSQPVDSMYGVTDDELKNPARSTRQSTVINVPKIPNPFCISKFEVLKARFNPLDYQTFNNGIDLYENVLGFVLNNL